MVYECRTQSWVSRRNSDINHSTELRWRKWRQSIERSDYGNDTRSYLRATMFQSVDVGGSLRRCQWSAFGVISGKARARGVTILTQSRSTDAQLLPVLPGHGRTALLPRMEAKLRRGTFEKRITNCFGRVPQLRCAAHRDYDRCNCAVIPILHPIRK